MAITHFRGQMIAASRGPVAAAAYRHRASMYDQVNERSWDYSGKADLVHAEIQLPGEAPAWIATAVAERSPALASQLLWNMAAQAETSRYDAQAAREIIIALPIELSREQNIALVRDYVAGELTSRGIAADWTFHDAPGNPHIHLMHTLRPLTDTGFGSKVRPRLDDNGIPKRSDPTPDRPKGQLLYERFAGSPDDYRALRNSWADYTNKHYALAGHAITIDMRSYAERGIPVTPTRHLGPAITALVRRGFTSDFIETFKADAAERQKQVEADPSIVLDIVAATHATFDAKTIGAVLDQFITTDDGAFQRVADAILAHPDLVTIAQADASPAGDVITPRLYATQQQINDELSVINTALALAREATSAPSRSTIAKAIADTETSLGPGAKLSPEQRLALDYLTAPTAIRNVVGIAGAGKSTLLKAANVAWTANGTRVHGAALAGIATRGLQDASGIASRTIAQWLNAWSQGQDLLQAGDVLVLDEAGMVGTTQMRAILSYVAKANAKIVTVGDPEQLQPIAAGAPFRALIDTTGQITLSNIMRQRSSAHRDATAAFADHDIQRGLAIYRRENRIQTHEYMDDAIDNLTKRYLLDLPQGSTIALAYTNAVVERLNLSIRAALRGRGGLGADVSFATKDGERSFAVRDRVLLLATGKATTSTGAFIRVNNGSLGTITAASNDSLTAKLDSGETIVLTPDTYNTFSHGYAATIHKSQGMTVDRAHVLVTSSMDRAKAYVAFSRHRHDLTIYEPQSSLNAPLETVLSKRDRHDNAVSAANYRDRRFAAEPLGFVQRQAARLGALRAHLEATWSRMRTAIAPAFAKLSGRMTSHAISRVHKDLSRIGLSKAATVRVSLYMQHGIAPDAIAEAVTKDPAMTPWRAPAAWTKLVDTVTSSLAKTTKPDAVDDFVPFVATPAGKELSPPLEATPAPRPPSEWKHTASRLDFSGDTERLLLSFPYDKEANAIASTAGFKFDKDAAGWVMPIADLSQYPATITARRAIEDRFEQRAVAMSTIAKQAAPLQHALSSIGVSIHEKRIVLNVPKGNDVSAGMTALGARWIDKGSHGYWSMPPPSPEEADIVRAKLEQIDNRIQPPVATQARADLKSPHPGIALATDGAYLYVKAAALPHRATYLQPLQAQLINGEHRTRLDIHSEATRDGALKGLANYYARVIVPPVSPTTGVDFSPRGLDDLIANPVLANGPQGRTVAARIQTMLTNHFGPDLASSPAFQALAPDRAAAISKAQAFTETIAAQQSPNISRTRGR